MRSTAESRRSGDTLTDSIVNLTVTPSMSINAHSDDDKNESQLHEDDNAQDTNGQTKRKCVNGREVVIVGSVNIVADSGDNPFGGMSSNWLDDNDSDTRHNQRVIQSI